MSVFLKCNFPSESWKTWLATISFFFNICSLQQILGKDSRVVSRFILYGLELRVSLLDWMPTKATESIPVYYIRMFFLFDWLPAKA